MMGGVLEAIVLPKIQELKDDFDEHKEENKKQHEENLEQHTEIIDSSNRIETLAKSEIKYVDDLSKRVVVLETKKV
jgi:F0F1-type ATP synthase membrane subunit b/b'